MFAGYKTKQRESSAYLIRCDVRKTEIHIWWSVGCARLQYFFLLSRDLVTIKSVWLLTLPLKGISWPKLSMLINATLIVLIWTPIPTLESILPISESDQPTGTQQRWFIFVKMQTASKQQDPLQRLALLFNSATVESRRFCTTLNINRRSNAI